jgi:hypothetical protein
MITAFKLVGLTRRVVGLLLLLELMSSVGGIAPAFAQDYIPPDRGAPGRREGGGTRGGCMAQQPSSQPSLTALMPDTNSGLTLAEHPAFFWYVPQSSATAAEFVLLDQSDTEVYKTTLPVPAQAGVVSINLPAEAPALEVGKSYHWYFSLVCDPLDRSADVFTSGWVKRTAPAAELAQALATASAEAKPAIYAKHGIWYEALTELAKLRHNQPQNAALINQWQTLLKSVGLEQLANQPLLE